MILKRQIKKPSVKATVVLHLIDENNFEVEDIGFDNDYDDYNSLQNKLDNESNKERQRLLKEYIFQLDCFRDDAAEDLSEYSTITKHICKELWKKEPTERYCCINVNLLYTTYEDYFGEVDVDVAYEYEESSLDKEWNKLDMLQKGSKIYPISYEENETTYTVVGLFEVHDNEYQEPGIYYQLHSDNLGVATGYYPLRMDLVDNGRYFSSKEKAHEAYVHMKENYPLQANFVKEAETMDSLGDECRSYY